MAQVTIGRRLYVFFLNETLAQAYAVRLLDPLAPCDAGVLFVHLDGTVNLQVTDHLGYIQFFDRVVLKDPAEEPSTTLEVWAEWIPYQKAVEAERAAKVTQ